MAYTDTEFLTKIKPYVIEDMKKSGILASLTAAQAFIESNKGNSGLTTKANNLFGIKGSYNGECVNMLTTEYYNGVKCKVYADFRKYPSWAESIADHSAMFNRMKRYENLRGETDWKKATKYVKDDGYATSPTYTDTLRSCIERYKLYEWDKEAMSGVIVVAVEELKDVNHNPYNEPTKNIRLNSRGNDVRWLQYALNQNGYGLIVDGIAGYKTIGALKGFQVKHGLTADGICGKLTRSALNMK